MLWRRTALGLRDGRQFLPVDGVRRRQIETNIMSTTFSMDDRSKQDVSGSAGVAARVFSREFNLAGSRRRTPRRAAPRTALANARSKRLETQTTVDDEQLRARCVDAIRWITTLPEGSVTVGVSRGPVVLSGRVPSAAAREATVEAVRHLEGVTQVTNQLEV